MLIRLPGNYLALRPASKKTRACHCVLRTYKNTAIRKLIYTVYFLMCCASISVRCQADSLFSFSLLSPSLCILCSCGIVAGTLVLSLNDERKRPTLFYCRVNYLNNFLCSHSASFLHSFTFDKTKNRLCFAVRIRMHNAQYALLCVRNAFVNVNEATSAAQATP